MSAVFLVRLPDGRVLGRMTLDAPLGPVAPPFAYTWDDADEAAAIAVQYDGTVVRT